MLREDPLALGPRQSNTSNGVLYPSSQLYTASEASLDGIKVSPRKSSKPYSAKVGATFYLHL
jgi:hypothetical protein